MRHDAHRSTLVYASASQIAPPFFERGYYLTPAAEATKAYRLLADIMERTQRASIATFVMRGREYLVAIFARDGILCAETLRFHDEVLDPEAIDLPEPVPAPPRPVAAFERAIDALTAKTLPRAELSDADDRNLRAIIEKKQRAGKDPVHATDDAAGAEGDEGADVDLLETIRRSLQGATKGVLPPEILA